MNTKMSLTKKIIIFMLAGAIVGIGINYFGLSGNEFTSTYVVGGLFKIVGTLFIKLLKMMVVPLVFVSLFCGAAALKEPSQLGKLGGKTLILYLFTTAIALVLAITFAYLIKPGVGFEIPNDFEPYVGKQAPTFISVIIGMVPDNPIEAFAKGKMLQIIVFSILLGLAATMAGKAGQRVIDFFSDLNDVIMKLVHLIMELAPYAVFALIAKVFSELGFGAIKTLSGYFFTVLLVLFIHALVVYPVLLTTLARLNPFIFLNKIKTAMVFAFGSASSNATIPVTMRTVTKRIGVKQKVAAFTVPFGATINMDGTAIMQGVATIFIANVYGIDLTLAQLGTVVLMATLASVGTAGVPGVGLLMLSGVLTQVGLPVEGIGLILGIDRLLDMTRTAVNVTGDAAVTCIVAKSEDGFDEEIFKDPDAGIIEE
ncbi:MAG TPA: dicarboxylate/amino acid:cation symporter [Oceanospirillales bacterium]|nr:dicarboxylate/amino acid:cation symporter [Oceanospirillales bacterium]